MLYNCNASNRIINSDEEAYIFPIIKNQNLFNQNIASNYAHDMLYAILGFKLLVKKDSYEENEFTLVEIQENKYNLLLFISYLLDNSEIQEQGYDLYHLPEFNIQKLLNKYPTIKETLELKDLKIYKYHKLNFKKAEYISFETLNKLWQELLTLIQKQQVKNNKKEDLSLSIICKKAFNYLSSQNTSNYLDHIQRRLAFDFKEKEPNVMTFNPIKLFEWPTQGEDKLSISHLNELINFKVKDLDKVDSEKKLLKSIHLVSEELKLSSMLSMLDLLQIKILPMYGLGNDSENKTGQMFANFVKEMNIN